MSLSAINLFNPDGRQIVTFDVPIILLFSIVSPILFGFSPLWTLLFLLPLRIVRLRPLNFLFFVIFEKREAGSDFLVESFFFLAHENVNECLDFLRFGLPIFLYFFVNDSNIFAAQILEGIGVCQSEYFDYFGISLEAQCIAQPFLDDFLAELAK